MQIYSYTMLCIYYFLIFITHYLHNHPLAYFNIYYTLTSWCICEYNTSTILTCDWCDCRIHNRYTKRAIQSTRVIQSQRDASWVELVWFHRQFGLSPPPPELYREWYTLHRQCVSCVRQRASSHLRRERLPTPIRHHRHIIVLGPICRRPTTPRLTSQLRIQHTHHRIITIQQQLHVFMLARYPRWGSPRLRCGQHLHTWRDFLLDMAHGL